MCGISAVAVVIYCSGIYPRVIGINPWIHKITLGWGGRTANIKTNRWIFALKKKKQLQQLGMSDIIQSDHGTH